MELKELHAQYGEAMVMLEIFQNKAIELKKMIADEMNKQQPQIVEKKDEPKN